MDLGTLYVKLDAITEPYHRDISRAEKRLETFEKRTATVGRSMIETGSKLAVGITAPLALATYQAGRFEQSMLDLQKVTDRATMEKLSGPLREMSETIPESASSLAGLATQAGRFGIQGSKNIQQFTKTSAQMATATDLAAEEAGRDLAKLAEMTNTPVSEIHNLGSAIVELGNNFATAESEIVQAAMRSASAMRDMGASQQQIFALSAALNEVFPSARRAGTGLRRVAQQLTDPKQVEEISQALGNVSEKQFRQMRRNAPVQTLIMLSKRMSQTNAQGRELRSIFTSVVRKTLTNLSGNIEGVNDALNRANSAYSEDIALTREFNIQSQGLLNQLANLWHTIRNLGTALGDVTMPAVKDITSAFQGMVSTVESLIDTFQKLPAVLRKPISYLTTLSMLAPIGLMGAGLGVRAAGFAAGGLRKGIGAARGARRWMNQGGFGVAQATAATAAMGARPRRVPASRQLPPAGTTGTRTQGVMRKARGLKGIFQTALTIEGAKSAMNKIENLGPKLDNIKKTGIRQYVKGLNKNLGKLGKTAGGVAIAFLGFEVLQALGKWMKDVAQSAMRLADAFAPVKKAFIWMKNKIPNVSDSLSLFWKALKNISILFTAIRKRVYDFVSSFIAFEYYVVRGAASINSLYIALLRLQKFSGKKIWGWVPGAEKRIEKLEEKIKRAQKAGPDFFGKAGKVLQDQQSIAEYIQQQADKLFKAQEAQSKNADKAKDTKDNMDGAANAAERMSMALESASQAWSTMFRATLKGVGGEGMSALASNVAMSRDIREMNQRDKKERKDRQREKKEKTGATTNVSAPDPGIYGIDKGAKYMEMPVPGTGGSVTGSMPYGALQKG